MTGPSGLDRLGQLVAVTGAVSSGAISVDARWPRGCGFGHAGLLLLSLVITWRPGR